MLDFLLGAAALLAGAAILYGAFGRLEVDRMRGGSKRAP